MAVLNSASGLAASFVRRMVQRGWIQCEAKLVVGTSGAVGATSTYDHPDITVTLSTTGVYTLTYPPSVDATLQFELYSPLGTITEAIVTAKDANAGTATIQLSKAGTAAEPASGDVVTMHFLLKTESY
jgi:hypothetical protein